MSSKSNETIIVTQIPSSRTIIFYIYIVFLIPSLACSILIFYYFIRLRELRQQSRNHVILAVLIILFIEALTDLPMRLYYLHENTVLIHTDAFCLFWNWDASVLNIAGLHLMALGSIERHLFVFHQQFLARHRLLLSRLPMVFSILYPLIFYTSTIFGSWWCTNAFDYSSLACGPPCYLIVSTFYPVFGILTHHVLPVFIMLFTNLFLVIRVWNQKNRMNQVNLWRKNVRMSAQLLSIGFIYLIVWIPQCILFLLLALARGDIQALAGSLIYEYTGNFTSFTIVFCPFVALAGLPHVRGRIIQDFGMIARTWHQTFTNNIAPTANTGRIPAINI